MRFGKWPNFAFEKGHRISVFFIVEKDVKGIIEKAVQIGGRAVL